MAAKEPTAKNLADLYDRLRTGGVTILEEPSDQPWGEQVVTDPDGNHVIIGARKLPR